jgi:DNA-directed RNA polymerase subunit RPC12/RpoP
MTMHTPIPPPLIAQPACPKCGTRMLLVRIFPDSPGHDQRVYECPRCEHEITEVVQFRKAS